MIFNSILEMKFWWRQKKTKSGILKKFYGQQKSCLLSSDKIGMYFSRNMLLFDHSLFSACKTKAITMWPVWILLKNSRASNLLIICLKWKNLWNLKVDSHWSDHEKTTVRKVTTLSNLHLISPAQNQILHTAAATKIML